MTRTRLLAVLAAGVLLGAGGAYVLFESGWPVLGARGGAGEGAGGDATRDATADAPEPRADEPAWSPEPLAFRVVDALGGLPAPRFHGAPSWGDVDGDGDADLFVGGGEDQPCGLFLNVGRGVLIPVADRLRLPEEARFHTGSFADFDADGDLDLYLAGAGATPDRLLAQHPDGRFETVSEEYGLATPAAGETRDAAWCDLDGDGRLDLFVLRAGAPDLFHRREAGATFHESAAEAGLDAPLDPRRALIGDIDGDGDLDLLLSAGDAPGGDRLFANRGDATFVEVGAAFGFAAPLASRCAALGDADGDGVPDLVLAPPGGGLLLLRALEGERTAPVFEDVTEESGLAAADAVYDQLALADLDLDGALDLLALGSGGLQLFRNLGGGAFDEQTARAGLAELGAEAARSFALADLDLDGDVDLALSGGERGPFLLRNQAGPAPWIRVEPHGLAGNPQGLGARVRVVTPRGLHLARSVGFGRDEATLSIGLAGEPRALEVLVDWSDGGQTRVQGVPAGERVRVDETRAPRLVATHPAALLGEAPSFPLEPALARASEQLGGKLPAPDAAEAARRVQTLFAWAAQRGIPLTPATSKLPRLAAALARIDDETRVERALRVAVQRVRVPQEAIAERAAARSEQWDRPARVAGTVLVARDLSTAERARELATRGEHVAAIAAQLALPELERPGPAPAGHHRAFVIDAPLWARLAGGDLPPFASGALPEPGSVSPVLARGDGYAVLVVDEVLPPSPLPPRTARASAESELRRARSVELVDDLLGLPAPAPPPRSQP